METVDIEYNGETLTVVGDYVFDPGDRDTQPVQYFSWVDAFVGDTCVSFLVEMFDVNEISKIEAACLEEIESR
jgi:hypothetical protein